MENLESVQRDLKNKLLGRIDEVHDDVKQLRQIVDTNLEDIANELMAKNSKVSGVKVLNKMPHFKRRHFLLQYLHTRSKL